MCADTPNPLYADLGIYPQNQIGDNTTSSSPFVTADDVVYFRGTDDKLWRVNSGGTNQFQVGTNTTKAKPFVFADPVTGEWVYFQGTDDRLLKVRGDRDGSDGSNIGGNKTKSTPFVTFDSSAGDVWVFFQGTDDRLLKVKSDGTGGLNIGNNKTKSAPFVLADPTGEWVYFQGTDDRLLRVRSDGSDGSNIGNNKTKSTPFVTFDSSTGDVWVFFQGTDDRLLKVKSDGTGGLNIGNNTTKSAPFVVADPVTGEWVYFQGTDDKLWRVRSDSDGTDPSLQSQPGNNTTSSTPAVGRMQHVGYQEGRWVYFRGTDDKLWRIFQAERPLIKDGPKQPERILEIQYTNPEHKPVSAPIAQIIAFGHEGPPHEPVGGPFPSIDCQQEWKQVLPTDLTDTNAHEADHEGPNLVGATGWVLNPECSGADVPFDHPFGFDWEFMLSLDQPAADPTRYTFLHTRANQTCEEEGYFDAKRQADDKSIIIPKGPDGLPALLGVEIDGGLVPQQFLEGVVAGDRIAVFGRWIVDCGHQKPITECRDPKPNKDVPGADPAFRTEIHPPLLMAAARVTTDNVTRVLFCSRPYLVGQRFTTDTDTIWDDSGPDDGPFVPHLVNEWVKVNETIGGIPTASTMVEAHPKIKSKPFSGAYSTHFVVRSPLVFLRPHVTVPPVSIVVSYQFTVRSGCRVQVTSSAPDSVDVVITLDSNGYLPAPRPHRRERVWPREELIELDPKVADAFGDAEWGNLIVQGLRGSATGFLVAQTILDRGIKTDEYDIDELRNVNILDTSHAVTAPGDNIPAEQGVVLNDDQPFPVYGWLEVRPVPPDIVVGPPLEEVHPAAGPPGVGLVV